MRCVNKQTLFEVARRQAEQEAERREREAAKARVAALYRRVQAPARPGRSGSAAIARRERGGR